MSRGLPPALSLALGLLVACQLPMGCGRGSEPSAQTGALDGGWIGLLVQEPQSFRALVEGDGREGWAALHRGDYATAADVFGQGLPAARARDAEAALYEDLSRLAHLAFERTFSTWAGRSGLPRGSAIPLVAALAALDAGDVERARDWLDRGGGASDPEVASAVAALADALEEGGAATGLPALPGSGALARRVGAHREARATGSLDNLVSYIDQPLIQEPGTTEARVLHDPLVFGTLAAVARARARAALGGRSLAEEIAPLAEPPLEALLFSPWWSADDLRADLARDPALGEVGASTPGWLRAGPLFEPGSPDSADAARARVIALDARLDAWTSARLASAEPDGVELLSGLDLASAWRSQALLCWARAALDAGRPYEALVYARLGQDLERPREIGPTNPPGLYAVLAEAELRAGHARQALDALQPLVDQQPLLRGLGETLGDLAVLEGIGRLGDSKEN